MKIDDRIKKDLNELYNGVTTPGGIICLYSNHTCYEGGY